MAHIIPVRYSVVAMPFGLILLCVYLWNSRLADERIVDREGYNAYLTLGSEQLAPTDNLGTDAFSPANFSHFRSTAVTVFYNRLPKCGSSSVRQVMDRISAQNGYNHHFFKIYNRRNTSEQADIFNFTQWYSQCELQQRCLFNAHKFFIDFSMAPFDRFPPPVYINLVRDPLQRVMSSYYYARFKNMRSRLPMPEERRLMTFDECVDRALPACVGHHGLNHLSVTFFCGTDPVCALYDQSALQRAKRNIIRHYAVVGYLENLSEFYEALELALPDWFKGILNVYLEMLEDDEDKVNVTPSGNKTLAEENIFTMKSVLKSEYDLYYFIRQRFHFILNMLKTNGTGLEH